MNVTKNMDLAKAYQTQRTLLIEMGGRVNTHPSLKTAKLYETAARAVTAEGPIQDIPLGIAYFNLAYIEFRRLSEQAREKASGIGKTDFEDSETTRHVSALQERLTSMARSYESNSERCRITASGLEILVGSEGEPLSKALRREAEIPLRYARNALRGEFQIEWEHRPPITADTPL